MSNPPTSLTYVTQAIRNELDDRESFHKFFDCWLVEQNQHLHELVSAANEREEDRRKSQRDDFAQQEIDKRTLGPHVQRVIEHYEHYYRAKSRWARNNVLSMFNPSWLSSLEDAFLWIGGWRPTMAFQLLYSKSGLQLEARFDELMQGISTGDLGDLSPDQLEKVDKLQRETIKEEKEITEKLAAQQETVADSAMVEMAQAATEMMREGGEVGTDEQVELALAPKERGMMEILQEADELRLKTLKKVVETLSPAQGVHFLIAAAALHLMFHEWGKKRDSKNN